MTASIERPSPQQTAEAVGNHLHEGHFAVDLMGIRLAEIGPGRAVMRMTVQAGMLNSAGICHGGLVFAFGDTVLAYASCSHGTQTVSQEASINWIRGAREGDLLTATCTEVAMTGKSGVYDITIVDQRGDLIAVMRGLTRTINLSALPPEHGA